MKVTSVSIQGANDEEMIRFDLARNTESQSPYQIKEIIGLDADELVPKFYGFNSFNTQAFYDVRMKPRIIVMKIVLNPRFNLDEDHSYIRDHVYRAISGTRSGQLDIRFHSGGSTVSRLYGFIKKFEVPYFDRQPEIRLTIQCNDPMFRSINQTVLNSDDLGAMNPLTMADGSSTAPHGVYMILNFTGTCSEFELRDGDSSADWTFRIMPDSAFLAGDQLHISSEGYDFGKRLYVIRAQPAGVEYLMDKVQPPLQWPMIFPGFNEFWSPQWPSFQWVYWRYYNAYWGV